MLRFHNFSCKNPRLSWLIFVQISMLPSLISHVSIYCAGEGSVLDYKTDGTSTRIVANTGILGHNCESDKKNILIIFIISYKN